MVTNSSQRDYRYISRRLVREIVDEEASTDSRWKPTVSITAPVASVGLKKDAIDTQNYFALAKEATKAVKEITSTIGQGYDGYVRAELDLTMGFVEVLMGWRHKSHVEIAAMRAEVDVPKVGKVFVGLFGSAANYRGRKPVPDKLPGIPSDVDGLYGILERTREPEDPEIEDHRLNRDLGHDRRSRADSAISLLNGPRFRGFREDHCDVLLYSYSPYDESKSYDLVVVGAPVWVAIPKPRPKRTK